MSDSYNLDDLPEDESIVLYEESSVKSVSEAIRAITGRNEKYSHLEQPDVIRNLRKYIYPFFMLGPGSGGIGTAAYWGSAGGFKHGPVFPNLLYNCREKGKNINIIFKIIPAASGSWKDVLIATISVGGHTISVTNNDTPPVIKINNSGNYDYSSYGECKIVIDTHDYGNGVGKLYLYIDDTLYVDGLFISANQFEEHNEEGREWLDFSLPSSKENTATTAAYHTCEIKYFRMEMEDW